MLSGFGFQVRFCSNFVLVLFFFFRKIIFLFGITLAEIECYPPNSWFFVSYWFFLWMLLSSSLASHFFLFHSLLGVHFLSFHELATHLASARSFNSFNELINYWIIVSSIPAWQAYAKAHCTRIEALLPCLLLEALELRYRNNMFIGALPVCTITITSDSYFGRINSFIYSSTHAIALWNRVNLHVVSSSWSLISSFDSDISLFLASNISN